MGREIEQYYVYILTNRCNKTLYIGVTNDLIRRIYEHRNHLMQGFTDKYNVTKLVYFEIYKSITDAIYREKQLKNWKRKWKDDLINNNNPEWNDLWNEISDSVSSTE